MTKKKINKWVLLPLMVCFLKVFVVHAHPLKLSVCDIDYKSNVLKINIKMFYDDLEVELTNYYKKEVKIYNESLAGERLKLIENYLNSHFQLKINGKIVALKLKSAQMNGDQVLVEFDQPFQKPNKLEQVLILNKILFNSIPEQRNIVNINLLENGSSESLLFENENQTTTRELTY